MIAKAEVWAPCQARGIGGQLWGVGGLASIVCLGDLRAVLQKRGDLSLADYDSTWVLCGLERCLGCKWGSRG